MAESAQEIVPGSEVTLHFSLTTTDGFEAISTFEEEPETIVMGDGALTEGLELALYGLKTGDQQTLTLTQDQAFGPRDESAVQLVPREDFPADTELEVGQIFAFSTPEDEEVAGTLLEVGESEITVDSTTPWPEWM
jgi:FKBP-type peptidyl-prolyl cis-trans isomerase SlpA